jgi:uncharacterized protein YceK
MKYLIAIVVLLSGCVGVITPNPGESGRFKIENHTEGGHGLYLVTENKTKREFLCNCNGGIVEITR